MNEDDVSMKSYLQKNVGHRSDNQPTKQTKIKGLQREREEKREDEQKDERAGGRLRYRIYGTIHSLQFTVYIG